MHSPSRDSSSHFYTTGTGNGPSFSSSSFRSKSIPIFPIRHDTGSPGLSGGLYTIPASSREDVASIMTSVSPLLQSSRTSQQHSAEAVRAGAEGDDDVEGEGQNLSLIHI